MSESKGEDNVERPSYTSCPDGRGIWYLGPYHLSCWLWGADSFYFGYGFVSTVGEGVANAVCPLQLFLWSMLGSSKVQRKLVYYWTWVAEGQTQDLWILMHGSIVSELTAIIWEFTLEQIWLFQTKCSPSEDNNNQMIRLNPNLHVHLRECKWALMPSPLTPHWKDHYCHGIVYATWHIYLCLGKLLPKSLNDLVERRSHKRAGQLHMSLSTQWTWDIQGQLRWELAGTTEELCFSTSAL